MNRTMRRFVPSQTVELSESSPPHPLMYRGGCRRGDDPGHPKRGGHPKSETAKL